MTIQAHLKWTDELQFAAPKSVRLVKRDLNKHFLRKI